MTRLAVLTLALLVSTAHADPKADVTGTFASFIDAVATKKFSGAKIKAVFEKWKIQPETDEPGKYPARAALGPDGEMAWLVFGMRGPEELCVSYHTFMVLAKEASSWKVVHQHYSRPHH